VKALGVMRSGFFCAIRQGRGLYSCGVAEVRSDADTLLRYYVNQPIWGDGFMGWRFGVNK